MPKLFDRTGKQYERLIVSSRAPNQGKRTAWNCICACGNEVVVLGQSLASGRTRSCGCLRREESRESALRRLGKPGRWKHGHCSRDNKSLTWRKWRNMNSRCYSPSAGNRAYYGGQGVSVCAEWRHDFTAFLRDMNECPEGLTLERRDPFGNYEKANCLWATWEHQALNHKSNHQRNSPSETQNLEQAA